MDWDNDGRHDLLVGDTNGNVQIFLNVNSNSDPVLSGGKYIQADRGNLNAGNRAAPVADDWNGDGKKDLIIGSIDGKIKIYINKGTDAEPVFDSSYLLQVGGRDFAVSGRAAPRVADWNKDGLKDLLVGDLEGYVYYLKNAGTNSAPVFKRAEKLFLRNGDFLRYPDPDGDPRSRLYVTDWNNDGLDDIVLGGKDGKVMLYLAAQKPSYSPAVFAKRIFFQIQERAVKFKDRAKEKIRGLKKKLW
ncbi:MAG: VCBS repeat-containing protein [Nitrospirae bacterium]|nr:VCBS repeat-containing protein [Nitrospirota bacterium]